MQAPNQEFLARIDAPLSVAWFKILSLTKKSYLFHIILRKTYNHLNVLSLPETVYLSTL